METIKKQITRIEELTNRTVKRIAYLEDKMFIFFIDATFCIIDIHQDYDQRQSVNISSSHFSTNTDDYTSGNVWDLEKIGIINEDELNQLLEIKRPIDIENFKQKELKQLAELKAKYEK